MANITVLGAGGFGTALAVMSEKIGHNVTLWSPFEEEIETIKRDKENKKLLPGIFVPENIILTTDVNCVKDKDLVIFAVPSFAIRETAKKIRPIISKETIVANVAKGFEPKSNKLLSDVLKEELDNNAIVVLTGPSHAEEVAKETPTSILCVSEDMSAAKKVQKYLMTNFLRIYLSEDLLGAQLGGALKNVIALAAGICDGLNFGDNAKAALITRGIAEISRLGQAMGADKETFSGLSGIGDLIVTCTSMHSRNRRMGILVGSGKDTDTALKEIGMTVEGYYACKIAYTLKKEYNVKMPIVSAVYKILFENASAHDVALKLMQRPGGVEN